MTLWLVDARLLADESVARRALETVRWPGRFELIATNPDLIVDGAHNVDSVERLVETVGERVAPGGRLQVVFGASRDKDIEGMLRALAPLEPAVVATASHNPRAADPERIVAAAQATGLASRIAASVAAAIDDAREQAAPSDTVLVTGSLYAVAEAREALGLAETPAFERELLY
jgi:dihydrofolate synthase/folylpolyglutamate synthase